MKTYSVYMLLCWDGSYYVGVTSTLETQGDFACLRADEAGVNPG